MDYKQELKAFLGENCLLREPMAKHTTYRTGGPAEAYVYPQTQEEWSFVLKLARTENVPLRVIGFGSNILVGSGGIGGIVCHQTDESNFFRRGTRQSTSRGRLG